LVASSRYALGLGGSVGVCSDLFGWGPLRRLSLVVISGGELSHVAVINFLEG